MASDEQERFFLDRAQVPEQQDESMKSGLDGTALGKAAGVMMGNTKTLPASPGGSAATPALPAPGTSFRRQARTKAMRGSYYTDSPLASIRGAGNRFTGSGFRSRSDRLVSLEPMRRFHVGPDPMIPMATATEAAELTQAPSEPEVYQIKDGGDLLEGDRYVAMNRFVLRDGAGPKFEARWANRKSRLATLEGFKYFTLMRRVPVEGIVDSYDDDYSYVSFTIWDGKPAFTAWRKGDAFKEAHGGTSIGAFLTTMVSSLLVLKGAPSPVFWDGLMHQSVKPESVPVTEGGWRVVEADGKEQLPTEAFIACNRFAVLPGQEKAFEERWASRESKLKEMPGFLSFTMLRRDLGVKMHGSDKADGDPVNYQSTTVWQNKEAFMNWRNSQQFSQAHGGGAKQAGAEADSASKPPPMWAGPPKPVFYEGVLVIASEEGA
jgi:heme-degrading monooxygenase HmoA